MSTEIYEIFHEIYGLAVDTPEPYQIGDFTFYQFPRDQLIAAKQYFPNLESAKEDIIFLFRDFNETSIVSVKIEARDKEKAEELARVYFAHLTNIFSYLLFDCRNDDYRNDYCISVLDSKPITKDSSVVMSKNSIEQNWSTSGRRRKAELSDLIRLGNHLFTELIKSISDKNLTKMRKKILLGIDFCGLATQHIGQPSSFVEAITVLECLLSTSKGSIILNISDNYAFIFGKSYHERIELKQKVKKLYNKRSDLAHGTVSVVSEDECLEAISYAQNVVDAFLTDEKLLSLKSEEDFNKYIEKLKFGGKENENA